MDYENFKSELYVTVLHREETAGKCVRLTEEELYILWEADGKEYALNWKLDGLYAEFLERGLENIMSKIVNQIRIQLFLRKYPVILRPMNLDNNRVELKDRVYWCRGDLSLVLYASLYESGADEIMMPIHQRVVERWGIEQNLLMEEALHIACRMRPPRLYYEKIAEGLWGYRLTVLGYRRGAVAYFYPGVKERLAEMFAGDYYVGFISVHEALIHPVGHSILEEMKAVVLRHNVLGERREMLTNQIFRYSSCQKRLIEV